MNNLITLRVSGLMTAPISSWSGKQLSLLDTDLTQYKPLNSFDQHWQPAGRPATPEWILTKITCPQGIQCPNSTSIPTPPQLMYRSPPTTTRHMAPSLPWEKHPKSFCDEVERNVLEYLTYLLTHTETVHLIKLNSIRADAICRPVGYNVGCMFRRLVRP